MFSSENCKKIKNLCINTKKALYSHNFPNGEQFEAAYHTLYFGNNVIRGQRDNKMRYDIMTKHFDFNGKNIIDFGCNTGGLLFQMGDSINFGIGLDYDPRCINCANALNHYNTCNIKFYVCDFDRQNLDIIKNYIPHEIKIDAVCVLSMGSWVRNWDRLYRFASSLSDTMIFEANNEEEGVPQLELLNTLYTNIVMISKQSTDDPSNHRRQLYLLTR